MTDFIKMQGITKIYSNGVLANNNVNFSINQGEIHAIAGENGAGKSTIMKILYGLEKADAGEIFLNGKKINISSPSVAIKHGIGMVHQHFMLVDKLNVYENIFLGIEETKFNVLDRSSMINKTKELAEKYNMNVEPLADIKDISVGVKQKIEILKVLARGAKLIILDEPTAVLTPFETEEFFKQLETLKEDNCAIILITHRLDEIKEICDKVTIMQNGRDKGVYDVKDISKKEISKLMIGKDINLVLDKEKLEAGNAILEIQNLKKTSVDGISVLKDVDFNVKDSEILCIAGVEGNGQRQLIDAITGIDKDYEGNVILNGKNIKHMSTKQIRDNGLAHIPEDRMLFGANVSESIYDNAISYSVTKKENTFMGFIKNRKLHKDVDKMIKNYMVKCENQKQKISMLSGGNMQKIVVAREVEANPSILVADQPTRGVDVGAIEFIHKKILQLRSEKKAVLLISSNLDEVFNLADKILVFHKGEITGCFKNENLDKKEIGFFMLGLKKMSAENIEKVINE